MARSILTLVAPNHVVLDGGLTSVYRNFIIENFDHGFFVEQQLGDKFGFWVGSWDEAVQEIDLLLNVDAVNTAQRVEADLVTEEFCFVCGRCTDHRGEHSMVQLLARA